MKTTRLTFLVLALSSGIVGTRADESAVLRREKGEVPAAVRTVEIDHSMGGVTVTAVADGFGWEWKLTGSRGRNPTVEAYAEKCRLEVQESNGQQKLVLVRPDQRRSGDGSGGFMRVFLSLVSLGTISPNEGEVRSELNVRVPVATAIELKNRFGSVKLSGTRGTAAIEGQNCAVDLADIDGAVTARTSFGPMQVRHVASGVLHNQNGMITASDVGGDLRATTSFGKMKVQDVKGHATLKNQNGAIEATRVSGDLTAATSFADMRVDKVGGKAELKGQNTEVYANDVTGGLKARTSFGALKAHALGKGAELRNENGNVEADAVTGDVIASTSFGTLLVKEIGGTAELECRNGKIVADHVTGDVRAKNSFAPVRVRNIGGKAELEGQNSEIMASAVSGDIRAQTSFARMQLEGKGRHFFAHNQNGAVDIIASAPEVREIEASATFAPIQLQLPSQAKPFIRANTSFGKVYSSFPVYHSDTVSDARFAAEAAPLKVSLRGQNGDIRIQELAMR